jgi:hypothetical protein
MSNNADYNQGYQDGIDSMRSKLQTMIDSHLQEMTSQDQWNEDEDPTITGWIECLEMYQSEMLSRKWRDYATIKPDEKNE